MGARAGSLCASLIGGTPPVRTPRPRERRGCPRRGRPNAVVRSRSPASESVGRLRARHFRAAAASLVQPRSGRSRRPLPMLRTSASRPSVESSSACTQPSPTAVPPNEHSRRTWTCGAGTGDHRNTLLREPPSGCEGAGEPAVLWRRFDSGVCSGRRPPALRPTVGEWMPTSTSTSILCAPSAG